MAIHDHSISFRIARYGVGGFFVDIAHMLIAYRAQRCVTPSDRMAQHYRVCESHAESDQICHVMSRDGCHALCDKSRDDGAAALQRFICGHFSRSGAAKRVIRWR